MKARGASEYIGRGEDYIDKADGQRKFVIPNTEARLSTGFTMGQLNTPLGGHKDVSLPAVLHHPELYRNYPELAEMRVRLYRPKADDGCYGFFHPKDGEEAAFIALNMEHCKGDAAQVLNTLLHESQHAIQMMEGFSRGAGVFHRASALAYLDSAIALRKKLGVNDEWSQLNMRYMKRLRARVANGDKAALRDVYYHARGEQEARFTGAGKRSVFKMGALFLGGESINTFGNVAHLLARGKKGDWRRAAAWCGLAGVDVPLQFPDG